MPAAQKAGTGAFWKISNYECVQKELRLRENRAGLAIVG
jgi:hypothetical protein